MLAPPLKGRLSTLFCFCVLEWAATVTVLSSQIPGWQVYDLGTSRGNAPSDLGTTIRHVRVSLSTANGSLPHGVSSTSNGLVKNDLPVFEGFDEPLAPTMRIATYAEKIREAAVR